MNALTSTSEVVVVQRHEAAVEACDRDEVCHPPTSVPLSRVCSPLSCPSVLSRDYKRKELLVFVLPVVER